jgi:hypothetical protein
MASTFTIQNLVDQISTYPEMRPFSDVGGFATQPALGAANDVMQAFLQTGLNWKWNRAQVPPFLTVTLQQDYVTNVTNLSWLEQGWRCDINNTANPKPIFTMEAVRDMVQTSFQSNNQFNMSWIPNSLAIMGVWQANTLYQCGYGQASTPLTPITQFIDANGNILFVDSSSLGLNISSPGYNQTVIPTTPPFGTSGSVQPVLPADTTPGTTVVDGTVTWTVADPDGYAIRLAPIPAFSGLCWLIFPIYQKLAPILTSLSDPITPIPDSLAFLFRQGLMARLYEQSPDPSAARKAPAAWAKWLDTIQTALKGADRELEDASFYPSTSLAGGGPQTLPFAIGPANPYPYFWN